MTFKWTSVIAMGASAAAIGALAHTGADRVVLGQMNGMKASMDHLQMVMNDEK